MNLFTRNVTVSMPFSMPLIYLPFDKKPSTSLPYAVPRVSVFTGLWRHVHDVHRLPGDLAGNIRHGMGQEMLVVTLREIKTLQRSTGFVTRIGGGEHGLAELQQMAHLQMAVIS